MGILTRHPFNGDYRITQLFGANPDYYKQFGLYGHEGIDLVPYDLDDLWVCATHDGKVIVRENQSTYGNVVVVEGEGFSTTYAHLATFNVNLHQEIKAGHRIGVMGDTGRSKGAHLHFGLRVDPYHLDDGWVGYQNPWHWMEKIGKQPPLAYGPHFMDRSDRYLGTYAKAPPAVALWLHPRLDDIYAFKSVCPDTLIVCRLYHSDSQYEDAIKTNPQAAAAHYHAQIMMHPCRDVADYWQTNNEVMQSEHWMPGTEVTELERLNEYSLEWMKLADNAGEYKCAFGAFSVGRPDYSGWRYMESSLDYAEANDHVCLLHQYGAQRGGGDYSLWGPQERGGAEHHACRLEDNVLPNLRHRDIKFIVGEYGLDWLLYGEKAGWLHGEGPTSAYQYVDQLEWMRYHTFKWSGRIMGYCLFGVDTGYGWQAYDHAANERGGVPIDIIADRYVEHWGKPPIDPPEPPIIEPPEPTPPPGGNMEPRVYNASGEERSWDWLQQKYGEKILYHRDEAEEGQVWRLVRVDETIGPSVIMVRCLDLEGNPAQNNVMQYWPGAPRIPGNACATTWRDRAHHQQTEPTGYTGFGIGGGVIKEGKGPYDMWICSSLPSDMMEGVGWLGGTDHAGPLSLVFQIQNASPDYDSFEEAVISEGDKSQCIQLNPDATLQKAIYADGFIPVGNEYRFTWEGSDYVAQKAEHLGHQEERYYVVKWGEWDNVQIIEK